MGCNDNDTCTTELAGLPFLTGCPANSEQLLVIGAVGGFGKYGYALRSWEDIKACIASGGAPEKQDFSVSGSSVIKTGEISVDLSSLGYTDWDIVFVRGNLVQTETDFGFSYYSYDKTTAILTLINGPAQFEESMIIFPII